ncbi:MAG: GNAT family N-acetyltransferase [Erysipelotrichales bacterium]|nr:MAG: GNAT family N-acetyltransferase [Erysipelotrichales bacterium]
MIYRKALVNEGGQIMSIIRDAVANMERVGVQQWNETYPTLDIIHEDILAQTGYVMADESGIVAYVCVNENQPKEYAAIDWENKDGKCCVIHRLVVSVNHQGQGLAKQMILAYEKQAKLDGYSSIRLDTYSKNPISMRLYPSMGYTYRGDVHFFHHMDEFPVFEKRL